MSLKDISENQKHHWSELLQNNPDPVSAVGSESEIHKKLRYAKLFELFGGGDCSVHDIGAGIGGFYGYLKDRTMNCDTDAETRTIRYSASEITPEYCKIAKEKYPEIEFLNRDLLFEEVKESYDYVVLSGVFHQSGETGNREWAKYWKALITKAWTLSSRGIAFNFLVNGADYYRPGNYYVSPFEVQLFITSELSRLYVMDQSYPLFEATFRVYRHDHIRSTYDAAFSKYLVNDG